MIPENLTYLFVNFFTILFPFIFSFTISFDFSSRWKAFFTANLIVALVFIVWDVFYTHLGVWGFNLQYTLGFKLFDLPLEEIMFFVCIPYACVFTYYCFRKYVYPKISLRLNALWLIFGILTIIIGIVHYDKLYTCAAFVSCGLTMIFAYRFRRIHFLHFAIFFLIILIPFYIFNGILTGSFLDRVVVYYNDAENLSFRILTVPFEDIFYGLALLLSNILLFEYFIIKDNQ